MKIVVNNKQGYKIYRNYFGRWGLRGVPSTPPGPDLTEPFYVESRGDAMDVSIKKSSSSAPTISVGYSFDKTTWQSLGYTSTTALTINVPAGGKVWLRANTNKWAANVTYYNYITTSAQSNVGGNIMSLLYGDTFTEQREFPLLLAYIFYHLFRNGPSGAGNIVDASKLLLPTKTLSQYCYGGMFRNCTSLTTVPELPATKLVLNCYQHMFYGCRALTTAPALPATTLANSCYQYMFYNCTSLTTAPALPATTLIYGCYYDMFHNCTGLTEAPVLPATTLVDSCYRGMFNGCTNLNHIKCLATDISASNCTSNWVSGVSPSGTFTKKAGVSWSSDVNGIPSGWMVVEE